MLLLLVEELVVLEEVVLLIEELVEEELELLSEEALSFRAVGARVLLEVELASMVLVTVTPLKNLSILEVAFWKPSLMRSCFSDVTMVVVRPPTPG